MLLLTLAAPAAWAQDAETDRAQALLKKGLQQYQAKDFEESQATLLKVDRECVHM